MGKIKTYKANTNVSINVVLASKKNLHISFAPLSNGSSTFTTDNEDVMDAIERHYNFGKLFRLHSVSGENSENEAKKVTKTKADESASGENSENEAQDTDAIGQESGEAKDAPEEEASLKKVKVSDLASAKDYLAETFGISRTALRSQKAIVEHAAAHGIEFEGLE